MTTALPPCGEQLGKQRLREWVYPDRGRKVLLVPNLAGSVSLEASGQGRGKPTPSPNLIGEIVQDRVLKLSLVLADIPTVF
jgi:hypothetical protein